MALNVGCHVGCMAWSPCGLVLALSVHNRRQPALGAEGPVHGMAALQLWRVAFGDPKVAQLRLGLVHQGAQARSLQWMASKKAKAQGPGTPQRAAQWSGPHRLAAGSPG